MAQVAVPPLTARYELGGLREGHESIPSSQTESERARARVANPCTEEPDAGNPHVRIREGPGLRPGLLDRAASRSATGARAAWSCVQALNSLVAPPHRILRCASAPWPSFAGTASLNSGQRPAPRSSEASSVMTDSRSRGGWSGMLSPRMTCCATFVPCAASTKRTTSTIASAGREPFQSSALR